MQMKSDRNHRLATLLSCNGDKKQRQYKIFCLEYHQLYDIKAIVEKKKKKEKEKSNSLPLA